MTTDFWLRWKSKPLRITHLFFRFSSYSFNWKVILQQMKEGKQFGASRAFLSNTHWSCAWKTKCFFFFFSIILKKRRENTIQRELEGRFTIWSLKSHTVKWFFRSKLLCLYITEVHASLSKMSDLTDVTQKGEIRYHCATWKLSRARVPLKFCFYSSLSLLLSSQ